MKKAKASKPTDDFPYYLPDHADKINQYGMNEYEIIKTPYGNFYSFTPNLLEARELTEHFHQMEQLYYKTKFTKHYDCGSCWHEQREYN